MMDLSQLNSIAASAAQRVGSSLSSQRAAQAPKDTPGSGSATTGSTTASSPSDITSDDFLTLLVSELKNQDPTQPTDPNQYITQLAQVNSLEQLISINKGIGTLDSSVTGSSTTPTSGS